MRFVPRVAGSAAILFCTVILGASSAPGQVVQFAQPREIVQPINTQTSTPVPAEQAALQPNAAPDSTETTLANADADEFDSLREAVAAQQPYADLDDEAKCLAIGVYYESKGEPLSGQLAVANVILNRTESGRFPKSVCGVLKQRGQFSFVRGGKLPTPRDCAQWREAVQVALVAQKDLWDNPVPDALFFHANYVKPSWHMSRVASLGNHIFYR